MADVRAMMKSKAVGDKLSGREKAQMLKSMVKEKRKSSGDTLAIVDPPMKYSKQSSSISKPQSTDIPNDFFDDDSIKSNTNPTSAIVKSNKTIPLVSSNTSNTSNDVVSGTAVTTTSNNSNELPVGFFDDIEADFSARGLNIHEEVQKKDNELNAVLNEFLTTVNGKHVY